MRGLKEFCFTPSFLSQRPLKSFYSTNSSQLDELRTLNKNLSKELEDLKKNFEEEKKKEEEEKKKFEYQKILPPLQAAFFSMTVIGIVANLVYQAYREEKAQHVSAIKLSFSLMVDTNVMSLKKLVSGQPVVGFFDHSVKSPKLGQYRGTPADLDRY